MKRKPMDAIPWVESEAPCLTTARMVEVDHALIAEFRIDLIQMMENAGRAQARQVRLRP